MEENQENSVIHSLYVMDCVIVLGKSVTQGYWGEGLIASNVTLSPGGCVLRKRSFDLTLAYGARRNCFCSQSKSEVVQSS